MDYLHSKHAGNIGDLLKHLVLLDILRQQPHAEYFESHAGAGLYQLEENGKHRNGISALWSSLGHEKPLEKALKMASKPPGLVVFYLKIIQKCQQNTQLTTYPGSPYFAAQCLAANQLHLNEFNPTVTERLQQLLPDADIHCGDGYQGVLQQAQNLSSASVLMIDPPYEQAQDDIEQTLQTLQAWPTNEACALWWYPLTGQLQTHDIQQKIQSHLPNNPAIYVELSKHSEGKSLSGSGLCILQPPSGFNARVTAALAWLTKQLGKEYQFTITEA